MKKSILLVGFLSLITITSAFSGHEGGGGDGVNVGDNRVLLRDFILNDASKIRRVAPDEILQIEDFSKLIRTLGKSFPSFAINVLKNLYSTRMYIYDGALTALPSGLTSLGKFDQQLNQLAIREGDIIIFSKDYINAVDDDMQPAVQYLLLHEALHGVLTFANGKGPLHHAYVRSVVHFIKNNIQNLDVFTIDNYPLKEREYDDLKIYNDLYLNHHVLFKSNEDMVLRCLNAAEQGLTKNAMKIIGLKCDQDYPMLANILKEYIEKENFDQYRQVMEEADSYASRFYFGLNEKDLLSAIENTEKRWLNYCGINLKNQEDFNKNIESFNRFNPILLEILDKYPPTGRHGYSYRMKIFEEYFKIGYPYRSIRDMQKYTSEKNEIFEKYLNIWKANYQRRCTK